MQVKSLQSIQSNASQIFSGWLVLFTSLFIISFQFPYHFLPNIGAYLSPITESSAEWVGVNILGLRKNAVYDILSDTTGLYVHTLNIFIFAGLGAIILWRIGLLKENQVLLYRWTVLLRYYLALQLLIYGTSKVFKWQFYLPEPNTLFTPLGLISPDLLYWSAMGASRSYTMFAGFLEVLPALLLLFHRTYRIGAWIAVAVLSNVLAINLSFDISVKLYASFLLLIGIMLLAPQFLATIRFLLGYTGEPKTIFYPAFSAPKKYRFYIFCKSIILSAIFWEVLGRYILSNNFNDDSAVRPPFHGAYHIIDFRENNHSVLPLVTDTTRWKSVFVHRRGYFIIRKMDDSMQDFALSLDTKRKRLILTQPQDSSKIYLKYEAKGNALTQLSGVIQNQAIQVKTTKIDLTALPLLQKEFHWRVDE
jgi:uncharacterized membrane protein YphA (DoxX/SURF4 family)